MMVTVIIQTERILPCKSFFAVAETAGPHRCAITPRFQSVTTPKSPCLIRQMRPLTSSTPRLAVRSRRLASSTSSTLVVRGADNERALALLHHPPERQALHPHASSGAAACVLSLQPTAVQRRCRGRSVARSARHPR